MKFLVTERQLKTIVNFLNEGLEYEDISGSSSMKPLSLKNNKYFVLHHTAGGKSASGIVGVLNKRGLGVQWIIDREGKIYKSSPGNKAWHVKRTPGMGPDDLGNSTAQGVEIIANNDDDVIEDVQCPAALKLIKSLGIPASNIYGHGEVSKHKARNEGAKCKAYVLKNWGNETGEPIATTQDTKDVEQKTTDDKRQKFFDLLKNFNNIVKSNETINNDSDSTKKSILNRFFGFIKKDTKIQGSETIDDYITSKIKELQKEKGLPETGVYDDKTVDALFKDTLISLGYKVNNSSEPSSSKEIKSSNEKVSSSKLLSDLNSKLNNENLAKGLVANAKGESGFKIQAMGDGGSYATNSDRNKKRNVGGYCSFGLWQYNICGGLGITLLKYYGVDVDTASDEEKLKVLRDYDKQVSFMAHHIKQKGVANEQKSIKDWIKWIVYEIERPSDKAGATAKRIKHAEELGYA
jgi:hypothetical protein